MNKIASSLLYSALHLHTAFLLEFWNTEEMFAQNSVLKRSTMKQKGVLVHCITLPSATIQEFTYIERYNKKREQGIINVFINTCASL